MHILYLYQYFTTRQGVGHTRAYEFARQFVEQGHEVTVVTAGASRDAPSGHEVALTEGIRVIRLRAGYSDYISGTHLSYAARIRAFLDFSIKSTLFCLRQPEARRADVLYASSPPLTVALPALLLSLLNRVPLIFEVRDCWPEAPIQMGALKNPGLISLMRLLEKLVYRRSKHVVALSPDMREAILATGVDRSKVDVVPNCADLDLFYPDVAGAAARREELGVQGKFVCLYFGAMGEANGLHAVLDSAEVLKKRGDEGIVFVLCGDGKERQGLVARASALGLSNVIFVDPVPKEELATIVASADVCLTHYKNVPILYTCSPNKLFDALSAGKPVIVNTPGWTKALLEEHEAGFYVRPDDPAHLADTLRELSQDPERIKVYGKNARALAESHFDRRAQALKLLGILQAHARRN